MNECTLFDKRIKVLSPKIKKGALIEAKSLSEIQSVKHGEHKLFQVCHTLILEEKDSGFQHSVLTVLCEYDFPNYSFAKPESLYRSFLEAHLCFLEEIEKVQHLKASKVSELLRPDSFDARKQTFQNIIHSWNQ